MSGLCVDGPNRRWSYYPVTTFDRTYHCLKSLEPGSGSYRYLTDATSYTSRYFMYRSMLSSRARTEISRCRIFREAVSKRWVATSSILTQSVYHSRKNTYQDNTSRAFKTIHRTRRLHFHTTRKLSTSRETMVPKQKIIIDTDPVSQFTKFNYQHPDQHKI